MLFDTNSPGAAYRARIVSLQGFWKRIFALSRDVKFVDAFYENVPKHRTEGIDLHSDVSAAGHDRCIAALRPENVDAWLNPARSDMKRFDGLLEDRACSQCEHRFSP